MLLQRRDGSGRAWLPVMMLVAVPLLLLLPHVVAAPFFLGDDFMVIGQATRQANQGPFREAQVLLDRPLRLLYFKAMIGAFGLQTRPFLLVNLLLHVANVLLAAALCRALTGGRAVPLLAALIFSSHYMGTWVTLSPRQADTLLAVTTTLGAVLCYLGFLRRGRRRLYLVALLLFGVGLLTRPTVLALPLLLLVLQWRDRRERPARLRTVAARLLPFFVGAGLLLGMQLVTLLVLRSGGEAYTPQLALGVLAAQGLQRPLNLAVYIRYLLLPLPFQGPTTEFHGVVGSNTAFSLVLLAGPVVLLLGRFPFSVKFAVAWFVLLLFPFLWSPYTPIKDRYMYSALVGGGLLLALLLNDLRLWLEQRAGPRAGRRVCGVLAAALVLTLGAGNLQRQRAWAESGRLARVMFRDVKRHVLHNPQETFYFLVGFPTMWRRIHFCPTPTDLLTAANPGVLLHHGASITLPETSDIDPVAFPEALLMPLDLYLPRQDPSAADQDSSLARLASAQRTIAPISTLPRSMQMRVLLLHASGVRDITDRCFTRWRVTLRARLPGVRGAALVGDFNRWQPGRGRLTRGPDDGWSRTLVLPAGVHRFALLADGRRLDPPARDPCLADGRCSGEGLRRLALPNLALPPGLMATADRAEIMRVAADKRAVMLRPGSARLHHRLFRRYARLGFDEAAYLHEWAARLLAPGGEQAP
jgi:hypothetical protein